MKNIRFVHLMILCGICIGMSSITFAQTTISTDKKDLIFKFRVLTGANKVNISTNVNTDGLFNDFSETVRNEPLLNEEKKTEILEAIKDAESNINKKGQEFFADKPKVSAMIEDVILSLYNQEFNEDELREAITFYSTPTGKKLAAFLPTLNQQVQNGFTTVVVQELQTYLQPTIDSENARLKKKLEDAKAGR